MKVSRQVASNTIIQFISKVISIILGLFTISLMTHYLGPDGFGEYTTVNTFLSFFAVAADLGLTLVTVQMISKSGINRNEVLSNLFSLRFFSALILLLLAPLSVIFFPYDSAIKIGVMITASSYLFVAMNQIMVGLFQKELSMNSMALAEIISRLALLLGVWLSRINDWGLYGILWVSVISSFISLAIHFFYARKFATFGLNFNLAAWSDILKKSWPIGLTIVFNLIYLRADTLLLSIFRTKNEVGIYGASYKVIDVLITLPFIFAGIILPLMTAAWAEKNTAKFFRITQKAFDLMSIIAVPMIFGTYFLADKIMGTVAGQGFAMGGPVLRLLIIAASIIYMGTIFSHAVIAIDKQRSIIGAYAFVAFSSLAAYFFFIPRYSYFGAAGVTIYSELFIALASAFLVWKHSQFKPVLNVAFKSILASLVMSLFLAISMDLNLALSISVGIASYVAALFIFKGVTVEDVWEIMSKS